MDLQELPLGEICADQLTRAYGILAEVRALIESENSSHLQFLDASNRFYTVIPQSFDASSPPPVLDNLNIVKVNIGFLAISGLRFHQTFMMTYVFPVNRYLNLGAGGMVEPSVQELDLEEDGG